MKCFSLCLGSTILAALTIVSCGSHSVSESAGSGAVPAGVDGDKAPEAKGYKVDLVVEGFDRPWGLTWLPDGRMLLTTKSGGVYTVTGDTSTPVELVGFPEVYDGGQGGLMDVAVHPDFAKNGWVYFTASTGSGQANHTTLIRGKLTGNRLTEVKTLFEVTPLKNGGQHFGSRIVWRKDKTMLLAIGDGGNPPTKLDGEWIRNNAQNTQNHLGKVLHLTEEGKPPAKAAVSGGRPEIYSYGHRNIQGMCIDPRDGTVYATEHGARGGDELNKIEAGKNYGWPKATYSKEYSGPEISPDRSLPGMVDPMLIWTPSKAPSGLAIYTGDKFPEWKGNLFSGGLVTRDVRRIVLDKSGKVTSQESIKIGARVRDVRQGPDGWLYVITDEPGGRVLRISR